MRPLALALALVCAAGCGGREARGSTIESSQRASYRAPGALITAPASCPDDGATSAAELSVVTGRTLAIADEGLASVRDARDAARRDRDPGWAVCFDEKLARLRSVRERAVGGATQHGDDPNDIAQQVAAARDLCEQARAAVIEATQCTSTPASGAPR